MRCPICQSTEYTMPIGDTHYLCRPREGEKSGCGTQFTQVTDEHIRFPFSAIFSERGKKEFYRKPRIQIAAVGAIEA